MRMNLLVFLVALLALVTRHGSLAVSYDNSNNDNYKNIHHIVVLMLENRAFDHMLGHQRLINPKVDGLWGNETCPYNPRNLSEGYVGVSWDASYISNPDPGHNLGEVTKQVFGSNKNRCLDGEKGCPPMDGFVKSYSHRYSKNNKNSGSEIMEMFSCENVPTICTLAEEFMIFDHWYSDLPGPTEPNRMFFHSGTSWGSTEAVDVLLAKGYPQKTIFDSLYEKGYSWRDYFTDFPTVLFFDRLRSLKYIENFRLIEEFKYDAKFGNLPTYSFIEPRWFKSDSDQATDQHPPHPVNWGENLIADIYEAVRNGPKWNNTLFIITYDEHGGFYDHVPTPLNVPRPDDHKTPPEQPHFDFNRLGLRVPTVFISPWLNKRSVTHNPSNKSTYYTHSSFPGTLKDMFELDSYLTKRDRWAGKWKHIFDERDTPRTDCPTTVPRPPTYPKQDSEHNPICDLQRGIMATAAGLDCEPTNEINNSSYPLVCAFSVFQAENIQTEEDGSKFVQTQIERFLKKV